MIKDKLPANNGKSAVLDLCSSITAALHVNRCATVLHARQLCILLVRTINLVWSMGRTDWHASCKETNSHSGNCTASP